MPAVRCAFSIHGDFVLPKFAEPMVRPTNRRQSDKVFPLSVWIQHQLSAAVYWDVPNANTNIRFSYINKTMRNIGVRAKVKAKRVMDDFLIRLRVARHIRTL